MSELIRNLERLKTERMNPLSKRQYGSYSYQAYVSLTARVDNLMCLITAPNRYQQYLAAGAESDLNSLAAFEAPHMEVFGAIRQVRHAIANRRRGMKPSSCKTELIITDSKARREYQLKSVVGAIETIAWVSKGDSQRKRIVGAQLISNDSDAVPQGDTSARGTV